jgi:hypothetical protein
MCVRRINTGIGGLILNGIIERVSMKGTLCVLDSILDKLIAKVLCYK